MAYHVLIPDNVDPVAAEILTATGEIEVTARKLARDATLDAVAGADGLIIRSATKADAELLAAAPRLKALVRAGVGVDNVDLDAAARRGVVVMNTPGGNTVSTAEHTIALMLALARHIPAAHASMLEGRWDRKAFMGTQLRGKTLGVVGLGRVGSEVAKLGLAFGMNVISHEPCSGLAEAVGISCVELDELYAHADIITLHPALTDETRGMINAGSIAQMKPGVWLINAARGELVDAAALARAIEEGRVGGAALDVYAPEPPPEGYPLVGLPNVVHTPHLAASTREAQQNVAEIAAHLTVDALLHGEYRNVQNPAALGTQVRE
jgi:D-3-phosphoglycerate dehydrogenase